MSRLMGQPGRLIAAVLAGFGVFLLLVMLLNRMLAGSGGDAAVSVAPQNEVATERLSAREFELPPLAEYSEITQRPLFSDDRRPDPESEGGPGGEEDGGEGKPATEPPKLTLTGVIITPETRVAMVNHQENNEQLALVPGDTLDGWTLEAVEERRIVFASGGTETPFLLEVYTGGAGGGGGGGRRQQAQADENQNQSAADQIRERIARERERRRQLIEEARKRREQMQNEQ